LAPVEEREEVEEEVILLRLTPVRRSWGVKRRLAAHAPADMANIPPHLGVMV
jgi:hypothetical protein